MLVRYFYFAYLCKDSVLSLNIFFYYYGDRIHPTDLGIKDNTDTARSTSYLDLHLDIYNGDRLRMKLYDKKDYLNFPMCIFYLYNPTFKLHLYMVYINLIYSRACGSYHDFLDGGLLQGKKQLNRGFIAVMVKS
jgi:hypothetical protein